jgi:hypothetical protein
MVQVARTGQLVMIAWTDWTTGRIRMRVSRDGATTFARPVAIGTTTNTPFGGGLLDGLVAIAIGSGVSHVAYFDTAHRLHVRRSLDEGATWGRSRRIGDASVQGAFGLSLAAGNDDAVLAYVDRSRGYRVATQVSLDGGAYWRLATIVSPWGVRWSGWPIVERRNAGSYLVAYELCADARCSKLEMRVAGTSNSGQSWPDRYVAGSRPARLMLPTGLAWTGRVIVSYVLGTRGGRVTDVWAEAADDSTPTSRPARHGSRR